MPPRQEQPTDVRRTILDEQQAYTQATIARAFEAFRHTPEQPQHYAPLFDDAHQALKDLRALFRDTPDQGRQAQHRLLVDGAREGLARAERIERMQGRDEGRER